jgi:outer membrane protein assembly factor BamB
MPIHRLVTFIFGLAAALCLTAPAAETGPGSCPQEGWGYRGDGSGVFPADCKQVTSWQEFAGTKVVDQDRDKNVTVPDPQSEEVLRNIVWKTPLPNMSESSPLTVGTKVFTLCEPGWPKGWDTPSLVCLDGDSGKILWQKPIDHFDALPPAQREEAKQLRSRYWENHTLVRDVQQKTWALAHDDESAISALEKPLLDRGLEDAAKKLLGSLRGKKKPCFLFANQEELAFARDMRKLKPGGGDNLDFVVPQWGFTTVGMTYATPVTDGELVYTPVAYGAMAAFDVKGELRWLSWPFAPGGAIVPSNEKNMYPGLSACESPVISEGLVLWRTLGALVAWDSKTGKIAWHHRLQIDAGAGDPIGSAAILDLDGTKVVLLTRGNAYRVRDGKQLAAPVVPEMRGMAHHTYVVDYQKNIVYFGSGGHSGHDKWEKHEFGIAAYAVRLTLDGERLVGEVLWKSKDKLGIDDKTPVIHGRLLLGCGKGATIDRFTGEKVGESDISTGQGMVIAGGHAWGGLGHHRTPLKVAPLTADGVAATITNHLGHVGPFDEDQRAKMRSYGSEHISNWYAWAIGRSYPFFSGNRVFYRTFDHLYCIGDPSKPFAPSKAFAER